MVDHSVEITMATVIGRITEARKRMRYAYFPSDELMRRMKNECITTTNDSLSKDYAYLIMVKRYRDEQIFRLNEFAKYLHVEGCGISVQEPSVSKSTEEPFVSDSANDEDYSKGVRKLAEYLRSGNKKANLITKSGVQKRGCAVQAWQY